MAASRPPLAHAGIVITRPVGSGAALARRCRALGAQTLLLPGLTLHPVDPAGATRRALQLAWRDDLVIFTSPAAVRFAARIGPMRPSRRTRVCAIGMGTARALRRQGILEVLVPERAWTSEGLLGHPALARLDQHRISLVGAEGGRELLLDELRARGAFVRSVHVYQRRSARLDRRHFDALMALPNPCYVLLSSADTLARLNATLPKAAWARLVRHDIVVSSARLARAARGAGFTRIQMTASATDADLLAGALRAHADRA